MNNSSLDRYSLTAAISLVVCAGLGCRAPRDTQLPKPQAYIRAAQPELPDERDENITTQIESLHPIGTGSQAFKGVVDALQEFPLEARLAYCSAKFKTLDRGEKWADASHSLTVFANQLVTSRAFELVENLRPRLDADGRFFLTRAVNAGTLADERWSGVLRRFVTGARDPDSLGTAYAASSLPESWPLLRRAALDEGSELEDRARYAIELCRFAPPEELAPLRNLFGDRRRIHLPGSPAFEGTAFGDEIRKWVEFAEQKAAAKPDR